MPSIDTTGVPVNRHFSVSDVWCVSEFLAWAYAHGYVFGVLHGFSFSDAASPQGLVVSDDTTAATPKMIRVLNADLSNREMELRSLVLEFFSDVMLGKTKLTL